MTPYQAAQHHAVIVNHEAKGRILLTGRDRLTLMNRMSTNKLSDLTAGHAMPTILTTPIGRIIDRLMVLHAGEEAFAITSEGRGDRIRAYFQRNIFFNDQVKQANLADEYGLVGVYGPQATALLQATFPELPPLEGFQFSRQGDAFILRVEPIGGAGYWVLATPELLASYQAAWIEGGASECDPMTYQLLCIEAGYPLPAHELTEDYIPLEAGLWQDVSFSKGCYTGQEIIARMESRGQLAKMLMSLRSEQALEQGATLLADGTKVGSLSSLLAHPDGGYIGFGYIKTAYAHIGQILNTNEGQAVVLIGVAGTQPRQA
jgi:aminomethyltransferase